MKIVFIDPWPPVPYDAATLLHRHTGGTTADVILLAEELAKRHETYVLQGSPPVPGIGQARYLGLPALADVRPDAVVYLRSRSPMAEGPLSPGEIRRRAPDARFFFWPHVTFPQPFATWWGYAYGLSRRGPLSKLAAILERQRISVVGVSAYHAETIRAAWPTIPLYWIYNPVARPAPEYDELSVDPTKLVYASSPERGLGRALTILRKVRRHRPETRLFVASPGYPEARIFERAARLRFTEAVVPLGSVPRGELFRHMRESVCLLQPNRIFRESFGRVFVEAHNLGTPVLTHPLGAAPEVVNDPAQLVTRHHPGPFVEKILSWMNGDRPVVGVRREFLPEAVARSWEELITSGEDFAQRIAPRAWREGWAQKPSPMPAPSVLRPVTPT